MARSRGRRVMGLIALALLVVPTVEIAVIVALGHQIGIGWTLLLLVLESALGAWIVRREGSRAWQALQEALSTGRMPSRELADAALVLVGGTLLLTPGFVTDIFGFAFVLPFTRPLTRRLLARAVERRLLAGTPFGWGGPPTWSGGGGAGRHGPPGRAGGSGGDVIEGEVVDED